MASKDHINNTNFIEIFKPENQYFLRPQTVN